MVRKGSERLIERLDHKFDGDGYIIVRSCASNDRELNNKGRAFAHTTLPPQASIGFHMHHNESEIYYILSGEGEFNDNGILVTVEAGDVTFTPSGTGHGIRNISGEPLELIALILYV